MTPAQSKAKASADAKARALAKAANGTESQVNNAAPLIYRAPQINVPATSHEFAALIQGELTKIEQSQSILLTLWEMAKGQVSTEAGIAFDKPVVANKGLEVRSAASNDKIVLHEDSPFGTASKGSFIATKDTRGVVRWRAGNYEGSWSVFSYDVNGAYMSECLEVDQYGNFRIDGRNMMPDPARQAGNEWLPHVFPMYSKFLTATDNLNSFTANRSGSFANPANANATPANNYPIQQAGALVVIPSGPENGANRSCAQLYYPYYDNFMYMRRYRGNSNDWTSWAKLTPTTKTPEEIKAETKAEIYAELMAAGVITEYPEPMNPSTDS